MELEEVLEKRATDWTEQIALAGGMAARVRIIEEVLFTLLRQNDRYDRAVDRCLRLIDKSEGQIRVVQLASEIGSSSRAGRWKILCQDAADGNPIAS